MNIGKKMIDKEYNNNFIDGNEIYLRAIDINDLETSILNWTNDSEVTKYMFTGITPGNIYEINNEFERVMHSKSDLWFIIMHKGKEKPIGHAGLYSINWISRNVEIRILIGDKTEWSKGYGRESCELLVRYSFERLNLNKVWLGVNSDNHSAVNTYKKVGFVHEGKLRQEIYRNGKYYDADRMSILRSEFYEGK